MTTAKALGLTVPETPFQGASHRQKSNIDTAAGDHGTSYIFIQRLHAFRRLPSVILERISVMFEHSRRGERKFVHSWVERPDDTTDPAQQAWNGVLGGPAQMRFQFTEGHLDRVEVGRIGRQIAAREPRDEQRLLGFFIF
jgi:hypothetical protein